MHFGNIRSERSAVQFLNKEVTCFTLISGTVLSETIQEISDRVGVNRYVSNPVALFNEWAFSQFRQFYTVSCAG